MTPEEYIKQGEENLRKGEFFQGLKNFNAALKLNPDNATALFCRGLTQQKLGRHILAVKDFDKALELDPHNPDLYKSRGIAHLSQLHYEQAIADFSEALILSPDATTYQNRALAYKGDGQLAQAEADFNKTLSLPSDAEICKKRGLFHFEQKNFAEAASDFTQALTLDPNDSFIYFNRGNAYLSQNKFAEAISDYTQALELGLNNNVNNNSNASLAYEDRARVYHNRALAFEKQGMLGEALYDFIKTFESGFDSTEKRKLCEDSLNRFLKKYSIKDILEAIKRMPDEGKASYLLDQMSKNAVPKLNLTQKNLNEIKDLHQYLNSDRVQVRRAARIIAQGTRDPNNEFFKVPKDIALKIAQDTRTKLSEKEAHDIAVKNLGKPVISPGKKQ